MSHRGPLLVALILTGAFLVVLPAATLTMKVDEVLAGMRGTGITVFQGTERSEFTAEIIGVLENAMGPRRNLILARLEGGPLAVSGVIQGMSGSPVYVDGRLLGAVSHSMGSFPEGHHRRDHADRGDVEGRHRASLTRSPSDTAAPLAAGDRRPHVPVAEPARAPRPFCGTSR